MSRNNNQQHNRNNQKPTEPKTPEVELQEDDTGNDDAVEETPATPVKPNVMKPGSSEERLASLDVKNNVTNSLKKEIDQFVAKVDISSVPDFKNDGARCAAYISIYNVFVRCMKLEENSERVTMMNYILRTMKESQYAFHMSRLYGLIPHVRVTSKNILTNYEKLFPLLTEIVEGNDLSQDNIEVNLKNILNGDEIERFRIWHKTISKKK